jgi:hypothetical protein
VSEQKGSVRDDTLGVRQDFIAKPHELGKARPGAAAIPSHVEEGGSKEMPKLRDDIRKYEADNGTKVKCFGLFRCLNCPMSAMGCPLARAWMK